MKRLIPAFVILAVILLISRFSDRYITEACTGTVSLVEQCEEEWSAQGKYQHTLAQLQTYWNQKEYVLSLFVNHQNLSDVEMQINGLFEETNRAEMPLFHERIETLKVLLGQICDDTKLNIKGLF